MQPYGLAGYINDTTSRIIGYALLRQVRMKKGNLNARFRFNKFIYFQNISDSCSVAAVMNSSGINFCSKDYDIFEEDTNDYGYKWDAYDSSYKPDSSSERAYNAFQYRNATDLNGYPLFGIYNNYWGGGYVYEMRGKKSYLQGNVTLLQNNSWIDRYTRAVMIEFSIYNPNINLFIVVEIMAEFLPSGAVLTSSRFDPINLLNFNTGFSSLIVACDIIYVIFIVYFMFQEIREICKQGKKYFTQFWSLVEWANIIISWAGVAMYAYRIYSGEKVSDFFKKTSGYGYYKFQYVAFWNETLRYCYAFCAFLNTLKFLKLLRFNKRVSFLSSTIQHAAKELIAFGFMFVILWLAFVQLIHLLFQTKILGFSTFPRSMTTCFQMMLGKFQVDGLLQANMFFGPLMFAVYNIFIVFILLNMFVSIINDSFASVRKNAEKQNDDLNIFRFLKNKFKVVLGNVDLNNLNPVLDGNNNLYEDQITYLPEKVDELLFSLSEVS
jgi:hypothetical protein